MAYCMGCDRMWSASVDATSAAGTDSPDTHGLPPELIAQFLVVVDASQKGLLTRDHCDTLTTAIDDRYHRLWPDRLGLDPYSAERQQRVLAAMRKAVSGFVQNIYDTPPEIPAASQVKSTPPQWLIKGWLVQGWVTVLGGHGGVGKTTIALQISAAVAAGAEWALPHGDVGVDERGLRIDDPVAQNVVYASYEESVGLLRHRIEQLRHPDVSAYDDRLYIPNLLGKRQWWAPQAGAHRDSTLTLTQVRSVVEMAIRDLAPAWWSLMAMWGHSAEALQTLAQSGHS